MTCSPVYLLPLPLGGQAEHAPQVLQSPVPDLDVARVGYRLDYSAKGGARSGLTQAQPEELASAVTALTER